MTLEEEEAGPHSPHWRTGTMLLPRTCTQTVVVWKSIFLIFSSKPAVTQIQPRHIPTVFTPANSFDTNHSSNYPPRAFQSCTRDWITHGDVSGATLGVLKQETGSCQQIQVVCRPTPCVTHEKTLYPWTLLHSRKTCDLCRRTSHRVRINPVCES